METDTARKQPSRLPQELGPDLQLPRVVVDVIVPNPPELCFRLAPGNSSVEQVERLEPDPLELDPTDTRCAPVHLPERWTTNGYAAPSTAGSGRSG